MAFNGRVNLEQDIKGRMADASAERLWFAFIYLLAFGWFAMHAVPSTFFGDNGELLTAIHSGGLPHPSGFPLFLLFGILPSKAGTFAVNLMSAAVGAFAVVLTALLARRLFGRTSIFFAIAVLMGSCSLTFQSAMARVYVYQLAFMLLVMLSVVCFKPEKRWGLLFGFLFGLSACTHNLFIGGFVFAFVFLFERRREVMFSLPWIMSGFLVGFSLYLWIPLRAHLSPPFMCGNPSTAGSLWAYFTLKQFSGEFFSRDVGMTWIYIKDLMRVFAFEWNPLAWVLGAYGVWTAWNTQRRKILALLAVVAYNILQLFFFTPNTHLILYRYFLPSYACVALLAGVGADAVYKRWTGSHQNILMIRATVIAGVIFAFMIMPGWKWADLSKSDATYRYICDLLRYLPRGASVELGGANQVFSVNYGMMVKGWRKDLILEKAPDVLPEGGCFYVYNQRAVSKPYVCEQWGLVYRIYDSRVTNNIPKPPSLFWMPPHYNQAETRNPDAQESLSNMYLMQAAWQADRGERDKALDSLAEAATIAPFDRSSLQNAAVIYSQLGDWGASGNLLKQAYEFAPNSFDSVLALGVFYGKTGQYGLCKDFLLRADQMKPNDPLVHRYLDLLNTQTQGRLGDPTT